MKKKILLILISMFCLPFFVSAYYVSPDEVPNSTYVIGEYMFTKNKNANYGGSLTTRMLMLASKSIAGNNVSDMKVYYKTFEGEWINGLEGSPIDDIEAEVYAFNISNVDLEEVLTRRTVTDQKEINGKTLNIEYRLETLDAVSADLYVNGKKTATFEYYGCGTGACEVEEMQNELDAFEAENITTGVIRGLKNDAATEYLYFVLPQQFGFNSFVIVDDLGNLIFDNYVSDTAVAGCTDFNSIAGYKIEQVTVSGQNIDELYYVMVSEDSWHAKGFKATIVNDAITEEHLGSCTANDSGIFESEVDMVWYEENYITKNVTIDGEDTTLTLGYYLKQDAVLADAIILDLIYNGRIIYTTSYLSSVEDELFTRTDANIIARTYDFGVITGTDNVDYIYLKEYKNFTPSGPDRWITIVGDSEITKPTAPKSSFPVGLAGQTIEPDEEYENYAKYEANNFDGYYIEDNQIYSLEPNSGDENHETAIEYQRTIGANGVPNVVNVRVIAATTSGAI